MAADQEDLDDAQDAIVAGLNKPSEVKTDAASFKKQDPIQALDVIDRIEAKQGRANGPFAGIQVGKLVPPGAVSRNRDS
jgi:hypothetical protein